MKINLGGGNTKREGYVNVDIIPFPNVDVVCDISKGLPFKENSVEAVYASHFLEHIENLPKLMEEIYRVCKPEAVIEIKCPYFKSNGAFKDPTHVTFITEQTFDYFDPKQIESGKLPDYKFKCKIKIDKMAYLWSSQWLRFVPFKKAFFLKHFWNVARSIYFRLIVIK